VLPIPKAIEADDLAIPEGVDVFASGEVRPFGFDVIGSEDPAALINWLRDNNYRVTPEMEPLLNVYVEEEFAFVTMRPLDGETSDSIKPIEITYGHMEIETAEISFSSFGGNDYLRSPERAGRYLTHLTTDISPEEMTIDPLFALEAGRADVSNVRDASELTGLWDCERNGTDGGDDVELANSDALDSTSESGSVTATPAESVGGGMLFSRRSAKNKLTESS
jgi:hypothetical protein